MQLSRTNIEHALSKRRTQKMNPLSWSDQVQTIFKIEAEKERKIYSALQEKNKVQMASNIFDVDHLETSRIYHVDTIRSICITYRLRFLDSQLFKGTLPSEAISKIKDLEQQHQTALKGFKILAPSKLFKLEDADDPLLFAPMGNDYYYLIHKWGNDLHPFRKLMMWPYKSFENLLVLTFLISIVLTLLIPKGLFTKQPTTGSIFLLELFFMFKSVAAIVLFYGFAKGKNFSPAIWKSKFYNA